MILILLWMATSLCGLLTQAWLFRRARLGQASVAGNGFVAEVARMRVWTNLIRVVCFLAALGIGVYAVVTVRIGWFVASPVGLLLSLLLLGFMSNGLLDLVTWRRIAASLEEELAAEVLEREAQNIRNRVRYP